MDWTTLLSVRHRVVGWQSACALGPYICVCGATACPALSSLAESLDIAPSMILCFAILQTGHIVSMLNDQTGPMCQCLMTKLGPCLMTFLFTRFCQAVISELSSSWKRLKLFKLHYGTLDYIKLQGRHVQMFLALTFSISSMPNCLASNFWSSCFLISILSQTSFDIPRQVIHSALVPSFGCHSDLSVLSAADDSSDSAKLLAYIQINKLQVIVLFVIIPTKCVQYHSVAQSG